MEPVIFWTALSAFLGSGTNYLSSAPNIWMQMLKNNGIKFSKMNESQQWFTINLDNTPYTVYRIVQEDESVIFIAEIDDRKVTLYRGENDRWIGEADQDLIDQIGKAIEEA